MRKALILSLMSLLITTAAAIVAVGDSPKRPLIMAHRGGLIETEENTLKAYNNAIDHGVDIIECDPKRTKDGGWIIMHDETLDRTTTATGRCDDYTLEEYKSIRTKGGEPIPTLEDVLALGRERGVIVFLDLHMPPPDIKGFFKIVDDNGMTDKVIVNTWKKPFQRELARLRPDIETCFPYPKPAYTLKSAEKLGVEVVGTLPPFATKRMIRKAHKLGMKVVTMPINDAEKMREFADKGLDIIQTDDPRLAETVFGNPRKTAGDVTGRMLSGVPTPK